MIRGMLLDGAKEGILYYLRGYGSHEHDIPASKAKFYMQNLGNIDVRI